MQGDAQGITRGHMTAGGLGTSAESGHGSSYTGVMTELSSTICPRLVAPSVAQHVGGTLTENTSGDSPNVILIEPWSAASRILASEDAVDICCAHPAAAFKRLQPRTSPRNSEKTRDFPVSFATLRAITIHMIQKAHVLQDLIRNSIHQSSDLWSAHT